MNQKSYDNKPSLYLIPTPIGNLDDITLRSLKILQFVDIILCEDTRESSKILNYYHIKKKLVSCHQYNEHKMKTYVVEQLQKGYNIGLITDQGTPIISDPGYVIVREAIHNHYNVISLPGATAFVPAITSSGISPSPFLFYGFLNSKDSKQKKELMALKNLKYTLVFYESVHRLKSTLTNMLEILGDRNISINREISKVHEEIYRDKLSNLIELCDTMKGEFVLVVEGNQEVACYDNISILEHVQIYVDDGISEKEAIKIVAKERNIAKSAVYKEYHNGK